ncbi:hypothetical protein DMC47_26700 [Nostoc sp. 3335mG]|nr:hypothetical protein DMC47_26700 [Nostoc sp. 3335mG]
MTATLHIRAAADPQTLPRVIGLFSQRWMVPSDLVARRDGDLLDIACAVPDLTGDALEIVAAKLREFVLVHEVTLEAAMTRQLAAAAA